MPLTQYTGCPRIARKPLAAGVVTLACLLFLAPSLAPPAAAARPPAPQSTRATPEWNPIGFLEYCWTIWILLGGDAAYFEANATTPEAAMRLVNELYVDVGSVPDTLTLEEQAQLRLALTDAEAMLRVAPPMEETIVRAFLKTISSMWVDLGGYPGDIGG